MSFPPEGFPAIEGGANAGLPIGAMRVREDWGDDDARDHISAVEAEGDFAYPCSSCAGRSEFLCRLCRRNLCAGCWTAHFPEGAWDGDGGPNDCLLVVPGRSID